MAFVLPTDRLPTFAELSKLKYKDQAVWFCNGFFDDIEAETPAEGQTLCGMPKIWHTYNKFVELENQQNNPKGVNGNELDQFWSAKLIEDLEEEAMTAIQRKDALKTIDVDSNGHMSLMEYLIWKWGKDTEECVKSSQGTNTGLIEAAQAKLDEVQQALEDITPKLEAAKESKEAAIKGEADAKAAEADAKEAEAAATKSHEAAEAAKAEADAAAEKAAEAAAQVKKAEDELQAALDELHAQEEAYHGKIAKLEVVAKDETLGAVKRGRAANELDQLKAEDPMPLRKAKISQGAALKKVTKQRVKAEQASDAAAAEADKAAEAAATAKAEKEAAEAARAAAEEAAQAAVAATKVAEEKEAELQEAYAELEVKMQEARDELDAAKKAGAPTHGAFWWMEREMFEADKRLPRAKQKYDHSKGDDGFVYNKE